MPEFGDARMLRNFATSMLEPLGGLQCGMALRSCDAYNELMRDTLGGGGASFRLHVEHDAAGAPYLADDQGAESPIMITLTDEDGIRGVAWAQPSSESALMGLGIDLAVRGDFPFEERMVRSYRRIFTEREWETIHALAPDDPDLGATLLFSAKEAAFKSASQRIRVTFRECGANGEAYGCPYFELRDIETVPLGQPATLPYAPVRMEPELASGSAAELAAQPTVLVEGRWTSHGISCIGDAAKAFEFLGIGRVEARFALVGPMVLCIAAALSE